MKCIILLTLVAVCYSYPYKTAFGSKYGVGSGLGTFGRNTVVNDEGTISIITDDGRKFTITRGISPNTAAIAVTEYQKIDRNVLPIQDTLARILAQYQGDVNQDVYQQLLGEISTGVQAGQIRNGVYQTLQNLNQGVLTRRNIFGGQVDQQVLQQLLQEQKLRDEIQEQQLQQLLQQQQVDNINGQQSPIVAQSLGVYGRLANIIEQQLQKQLVNNLQNANSQQVFGRTGQTVLGPLSQVIQEGIMDQQLRVQVQQLQQQLQQQQLLQQQQKQLMNNLQNANRQQVFGRTGQTVVGPLSQVIEEGIKDQQLRVQVQQLQQQQQQQLLLQQQQEQLQTQQQQQDRQQYLQELQAVVQSEQEQVLEEQQEVQQQQQQQQQQLSSVLRNLFNNDRVNIFRSQQGGIFQQQPAVLSQRRLLGGI